LEIWIFYKQPVRGGPPAWKLARGLVVSHSKSPVCYEGGRERKRRRSLVRYRHRWEYNIKMALKEIGWEG
jgi:hypothetical protein